MLSVETNLSQRCHFTDKWGLMRALVLVQSFVQPEKLDSAEAWYCPKCKEHVQASKKLDLWSAPEVLILHLKRFQFTTQSRRKIDAPVVFPLTDLDLSPYLLHQQVPPTPLPPLRPIMHSVS